LNEYPSPKTFEEEIFGHGSRRTEIYEQYALIIWNICETIYDRNKVDKTWYPVLKKQRTIHLDWLKLPENEKYFKDEFLIFIYKDENFKNGRILPKIRSRTALKIWKENRLIIVIVPLLLIVTLIVLPGSLYNIQYFDSRIAMGLHTKTFCIRYKRTI
jgi:hypothetical protein